MPTIPKPQNPRRLERIMATLTQLKKRVKLGRSLDKKAHSRTTLWRGSKVAI